MAYAVSSSLYEQAGVRDRITMKTDFSYKVFKELKTQQKQIDFCSLGLTPFIDHVKHLYLSDLKLALEMDLLAKNCVVVADNVLFPGAPDYKEYMSSGEGSKLFETKIHRQHVEYWPSNPDEEALKVNVIAPMALMQAFLPHLRRGKGRVLHLGTSVAHNPQKGTATYGITKAAFHRLYQQLNAEDLGVPVASLSPGLVDTEGVRDHVAKARRVDLPHVKFFDTAFDKGLTTEMAELMTFVEHVLQATEPRARDTMVFETEV
eukprot:symbB.v1.2.021509.t1/scaffold1858.1/size98333/2